MSFVSPAPKTGLGPWQAMHDRALSWPQPVAPARPRVVVCPGPHKSRRPSLPLDGRAGGVSPGRGPLPHGCPSAAARVRASEGGPEHESSAEFVVRHRRKKASSAASPSPYVPCPLRQHRGGRGVPRSGRSVGLGLNPEGPAKKGPAFGRNER